MFINLGKAFDAVDHNILIKMLKMYDIRGKVLNLLKIFYKS